MSSVCTVIDLQLSDIGAIFFFFTADWTGFVKSGADSVGVSSVVIKILDKRLRRLIFDVWSQAVTKCRVEYLKRKRMRFSWGATDCQGHCQSRILACQGRGRPAGSDVWGEAVINCQLEFANDASLDFCTASADCQCGWRRVVLYGQLGPGSGVSGQVAISCQMEFFNDAGIGFLCCRAVKVTCGKTWTRYRMRVGPAMRGWARSSGFTTRDKTSEFDSRQTEAWL